MLSKRGSSYSDGWKVIFGYDGAKYAMCCPEPDAISNTLDSRFDGRYCFNISRMCALLRSAAGYICLYLAIKDSFYSTHIRSVLLPLIHNK